MTDDDVAALYRCLLNRAPETPATVAAFQAYYPDFARGRVAVLQSAEFAGVFAGVHGDAATQLAHAFLARAGGSARVAPASNEALSGAMRLILRAHGAVHLAVVVADADALLEDVLPVQSAQTAVLHIATDFPVFIPQTATMSGGAHIFRINLDAAGLAKLLHAAAQRIDLLAVLAGDPAWFDVLAPCLAGQSILMTDSAWPDALCGWPTMERALMIAGLHICFVGGWFLPVRYAETHAKIAEPEAPIAGLCVAAIMRNEQAAAANMLASANPVAASFVVLDTGSTDDTMKIAEAYLQATRKPHVVAAFAGDRFDDMRNAALAMVPPGTAWVLMLDADEELCAPDHAALRHLLATAEGAAYALPRYNYTGVDKSGDVQPYPDRQVRLLRHIPDHPLRYSGAVHETIRDVDVIRLPLDAGALGLGRGGPHIHHLVRRFRSPAAEAAKQVHYRDIALRHGGDRAKEESVLF